MVWSEIHDVDLVNGYYSLVLGSDELDNPLDDSLLRDNELHLELTVGDDEPLSPRQAINAVPYARLAESANSVAGGAVNASEIRIGGLLVVNEEGDWVGATPSVDWSDLTGIPSGMADAEDADTTLTEEEVDAFCSDNGYAMAADMASVATSGSFRDLADVPEDADTQLSEEEVDAFCANNGYAMAADMASVATSGSFRDLADVPEDANTQLSEDEVDAFCANNGYAMAADMASVATSGSFRDLADVPEDADTQLSEDEVDAFVENNGYAKAADMASVATSGSYDDLSGAPPVVGVNLEHFSSSGTFTVPAGVTSLTVYVTGGGGGGSNGEATSLDLGTHTHGVTEHTHSAGSHSHDSGTHTHSSSSGSSTSWDPCASTSSYSGRCVGGYVTSGGGTSITGSATGVTGDTSISTGGDVSANGTATAISCGDANVECDGGSAGLDNGAFGRDGSCLVDGGGVLSQFKASHLAPGGGGAGGRSDTATVGSDGSVTIRY